MGSNFMEIYRKAIELLSEGLPFALGTVVAAQGSTPQKVGSKAILDSQGSQFGTLGGGLVEADGLRCMRESLETGEAKLLECRLDEDYSREAGPICGGVMRIFADPKAADSAAGYRAAVEAVDSGKGGVLLTLVQGNDIGGGRSHWVGEENLNGSLPWAVSRNAAETVLATEEPDLVTTESGTVVFLEPLVAAPRLLVVGGGHVGQAVARQSLALGFDVTVVDDREEYARPELFPEGTKTIAGPIGPAVAEFPKGPNSYIILVSKGHRPDAEALEQCIHSDAAFIGMIGSKRKIRFLRKNFVENGLATKAEFDRIVAPIGFDIGAITVSEIGVSIAAQLVAARRRKSASGKALHELST